MAKRVKPKTVLPTKAESVELPPEVPVEARALSQIERIAKMGLDYGKMFDQTTAKGLYAHYSTLTVAELQAKLKTPTLTALERSVIVHLAKINSTGKDSLNAIQYLHERLFGKVENKTEITGANGGPLKVENDTKVEVERKLTEMSDEELAEFEKNLMGIKGLIGKNESSEAE